MSVLTESQLRDNRRSLKTSLSLNESLRNFKNESSQNRVKVFLSHKHDELEQLEGAISFLKAIGVDIYVDWLDEGMPRATSGQTALRLKQKIKENHKFVFLATDAAINSKWCNWELGLGDAVHYLDHIALLPIKKENSDFAGIEYLGIYPYIFILDIPQFFKGIYTMKGTFVVYPSINGNDRVVPIAEWLRKR